jgi:hypothetical protein
MDVDMEVMFLARIWGAIAVRGVAAILFGLPAVAVPGLTLVALLLLFGAYRWSTESPTSSPPPDGEPATRRGGRYWLRASSALRPGS